MSMAAQDGQNTVDNAGRSEIQRCMSMTVIEHRNRWQRVRAATRRVWNRFRDHIQRMPLAYKLSFFITVLVVSCMSLLGILLIQQQSQQMQEQIIEQGTTLARLMAQSVKEPLLAEDGLALDTTTSSFAKGSSVLGAAISSLQGDIISKAGILHDEKNPEIRNLLKQAVKSGESSHNWEWRSLLGNNRHGVMTFIQPVTYQEVTAGYAQISFSQSGMRESATRALQAIIAATVLIIALGIAMAFALGRRITQPIDRLVNASRAIGQGDYSFRFKDRRKDELGLLMEAFNDMAQGMLEKTQVKSALSRYVSAGVARQILSNLDDVGLSGKRVDGSVLFADIKGFTQIAENMRPEELVSILNRYFTLITCACEINHGMVDKYMGDGVMLVFGAPEPDSDHAFHAIACALLIQKLVAHENALREELGKFPVQFRIGINTGSMLAGNMGSRERMEYTVVGDTVNLASRLCGITNGDEIVISREMYLREDIRERVIAGEYQSIRLRGISQPVTTYRIEQLTAAGQEIIAQQFDDILRRESGDVCNA
ncbi:MAG TPA: adenylate/guanylate cyclase domain-containing protein [Gammaproteobacteria bacterium]|nr:adenylate/guanylate cyclase domain-containing protein [Gammaproteobacteria bacterium]